MIHASNRRLASTRRRLVDVVMVRFFAGAPCLNSKRPFSPERELVERLFADALAVNRVDHAALVNGHLPLVFPVLDLDDAAPAVRQDQLHGVRERGAFKRYRYR